MLQLEGAEARLEEAEREVCENVTYLYIAWCLDRRYSDAVDQQPAVWLANLSSDWAGCFCLVSSRQRFSPSFLRFLIATSSWSRVSLHPGPMGCGNSGHFLHGATTAEVHKHSVKRISDRILTDCNPDSFEPNTVSLNCLINFVVYAKYFLKEQ